MSIVCQRIFRGHSSYVFVLLIQILPLSSDYQPEPRPESSVRLRSLTNTFLLLKILHYPLYMVTYPALPLCTIPFYYINETNNESLPRSMGSRRGFPPQDSYYLWSTNSVPAPKRCLWSLRCAISQSLGTSYTHAVASCDGNISTRCQIQRRCGHCCR